MIAGSYCYHLLSCVLSAITQAELMTELVPHVAPKWYMLAVLLNISKPVLDRITKSFIANKNHQYSLSEVIEAWLEEINAAIEESESVECTKEAVKIGEPSRYWLQLYHVIKRMGYPKLARQLAANHSKLSISQCCLYLMLRPFQLN